MKNKKVTITKNYLDNLKSDVASYKKERDDLRRDLEKHRSFYLYLLREIIKIHGQGKGVSASWLIECLSKHFNNVNEWWWT